MALHPASHNCPMERREPEARCGKRCVCLALMGSCGMLRRPVWDEVMVALFGRRTEMPVEVGCMFEMGIVVWTRSLGVC